MTQAFNLGQLANKVNTSGQLDASTGLVNTTAVANGGTGRATLDTGKVLVGAGTSQVTMLAGTTTNDALIWNGTAWASSPLSSAGGGGGYKLSNYTSPSSYTKPASLKAIKVTVIGGGGDGGPTINGPMSIAGVGGGGGGGGSAIYYATAPTLPASAITITAGAGTNSFGAIVSATGGAVGGIGYPPSPAGEGAGGGGGSGSGGYMNFLGTRGNPGRLTTLFGLSGAGGGGQAALNNVWLYNTIPSGNGTPNPYYGGGGGGGGTGGNRTGGTGGSGIIIIEEFF